MTSVYSANLFVGPGTGSLQTIYTSPAGVTTVVRDVSVFATSSIATPVYLVHQVSGGSAAVFALAGTLAADAGFHWEGREVLAPGDTLELGAYGSALLVTVNGYKLQ